MTDKCCINCKHIRIFIEDLQCTGAECREICKVIYGDDPVELKPSRLDEFYCSEFRENPYI